MSMLKLTPLGEQVAKDTTGRGPEFAVISFLYEADGPVDFEEVVDRLHTDEEKASMIVNKLIGKEQVKEV